MLFWIIQYSMTTNYRRCIICLTFAKIVVSFWFILKQFYDLRIVEQLVENRTYNTFVNLKTNSSKYFLGKIQISISDNVNIEIEIYPLFDDFRDDRIVFVLLPCLSSDYKFWSCCINIILYFFFFRYGLGEIGPFKLIFEIFELLTFLFSIFFNGYYSFCLRGF